MFRLPALLRRFLLPLFWLPPVPLPPESQLFWHRPSLVLPLVFRLPALLRRFLLPLFWLPPVPLPPESQLFWHRPSLVLPSVFRLPALLRRFLLLLFWLQRVPLPLESRLFSRRHPFSAWLPPVHRCFALFSRQHVSSPLQSLRVYCHPTLAVLLWAVALRFSQLSALLFLPYHALNGIGGTHAVYAPNQRLFSRALPPKFHSWQNGNNRPKESDLGTHNCTPHIQYSQTRHFLAPRQDFLLSQTNINPSVAAVPDMPRHTRHNEYKARRLAVVEIAQGL